jgi:oligopeptidase A
MALRHEAARLLGYANAAEVSLATKMAARPRARVRLPARARRTRETRAERELSDLRLFAASHARHRGASSVGTCPIPVEKLRQHRFALSDEEPSGRTSRSMPRFPACPRRRAARSASQLRRAPGRRRVGTPTCAITKSWTRPGPVRRQSISISTRAPPKRGGAWVEGCQARRRHAGGVQPPVAFLTCHFGLPSDELPRC